MDTCPMDVQLMNYESQAPPDETQADEGVFPDLSANPEEPADAPKAEEPANAPKAEEPADTSKAEEPADTSKAEESSADHPALWHNLVIDVWPGISRLHSYY